MVYKMGTKKMLGNINSPIRYTKEEYKGISINFIKKIIGNNPIVLATFKVKSKNFSVKGNTKNVASFKAKQVINRII